MLLQYLAHLSESFSLDYYVSVLHTFSILFHWIFTLISRALLRFSFVELLPLYLAHF